MAMAVPSKGIWAGHPELWEQQSQGGRTPTAVNLEGRDLCLSQSAEEQSFKPKRIIGGRGKRRGILGIKFRALHLLGKHSIT
jgi:hypothetical protein